VCQGVRLAVDRQRGQRARASGNPAVMDAESGADARDEAEHAYEVPPVWTACPPRIAQGAVIGSALGGMYHIVSALALQASGKRNLNWNVVGA
jgi:hypothetical protein